MKEVVPALERKLSQPAIRALALRVRINTGVNITDPQPEHIADQGRIAAVCASLQSMGYPIA